MGVGWELGESWWVGVGWELVGGSWVAVWKKIDATNGDVVDCRRRYGVVLTSNNNSAVNIAQVHAAAVKQ